jgi:hypothetical protein
LTIGGPLATLGCVLILSYFGASWITLLAFVLTIIFVLSELLVSNLPRLLCSELKKNCIRMDGTWSRRRERLELQAVNKVRWDVRVVFLLVLIPTAAMLWLVDQEIAPISIGIDAIASFQGSPEAWKANLASEESQFEQWSASKSNGVNTENHKRLLWQYWPLLILGTTMWIGLCWHLIKSSYVRQLKLLSQGIGERRWEYVLADRVRSTEWSDK